MSYLRFPPVVQVRWSELSEQLRQLAPMRRSPAVKEWLYTNMPLIVAVELEEHAAELRTRADRAVSQASRGSDTAQRTASEVHTALVGEAERLEARAKQLRNQP